MSSETTHAGRQKQIVFLFGQRVSECQLVWFGSSVQIAHRRFLRLLDGVPSLSSWWMPQSVKSIFACSHQVAASCHAVPSAVERDGRLLELDELPRHVAEPQSPVLLHPLQLRCVVVTADFDHFVRLSFWNHLCQKSWTAQEALLFVPKT